MRTGNGYGKPRFWRKVPEKVADAAYSSDIWMFFKILKIPADFLNTASDTWNNNQSYLKGLQVLKNIKLWNDLAERAINLTQDYCHLSKSEDRLQDIVQVVGKKDLKYQYYVKILKRYKLTHDNELSYIFIQ